jgi:hypothetical protein
VLLAVNMQTSFLHPPFGFALFYLRSVAPKSVRTSDIYWGAIPFVVIQVMMVAVVNAFPGFVTSHVTAAATVKGTGAEELQRQLQQNDPTSPAPPDQRSDDATSEIERALKEQK